ncbi:PAS domain S-box protein [Nannocystis radixulma]|uniref:histidine kinase n=1 Tax=Nannocystis radixulma TaxID=2995305 RepID=A0ABT5B109_9BACT|nr:PAS domain S-box protein [Nannocystis radixulma]MDC0667787.1 PAS domain S-box protein [Nannocystis radixulma]
MSRSSSLATDPLAAGDVERLALLLFPLFGAVPDYVFLISPEGSLRFVNRTAVGLSATALLGRSMFEYIHPDDHDVVRACLREVVTTGVPGRYEAHGPAEDGRMALFEAHVAPARRDGEIVALAVIARDISGRVDAEAKLRESRRRLDVAIAASRVGLWSWDVRQDEIEVDDGILQIHRRPRAQAPKRFADLLTTIHPDDREFAEAGFRRAAQSGEFTDLEYRIVRLDGTIAWIVVTGQGIRDAAGQLVELLGGALDVTALRQTAASLRASEQRYRSLIGVLEEGILVQDEDGTIHTYNASAQRILGLTQEQVAGNAPLTPRWHAVREDGTVLRDRGDGPLFEFHAGEPPSGAVLGIHKPDGQPTWVAVRSQSLPTGPDHRCAVVVSFSDITDRKNAELEKDRVLRQEQAARQRAVLLAETSKILASPLDIQHSLEVVVTRLVAEQFDLAVIELFDDDGAMGVSHPVHVAVEDEALAQRYRELRRRQAVEPTSPLIDTVRRRETRVTAGQPDAVPAPLAALPPDEELADRMRYRWTAFVPLLARDQPLGVLIVGSRAHAFHPDDITLAEELALRSAHAVDAARLYAEMETALARREEFIAVASHELRTPLTPLLLQSERLLRLAHDESRFSRAAVAPKLEVVHRQIERLHRLIEEMLEVSNITRGHLALELAPVDLAALVRDVVAGAAEDLAHARCEVRLDLPDSLVGRWDAARLEQIVVNLLTNAKKYGAGAPIEITLEADADSVELKVRDHGIGISLKDQQRIFQRFERAVSGRHYGGLGLGLWVTRHAAEAMGGAVHVHSEPGAGSTFIVRLPR